MIKKIIFPAISLAGVVASIPCVTTSCSSMKYERFSYKFDSTNKAKDFLPKDSMGDVELDAYDVTPTFINKMNENKHILADTITYGIINDFFYYEGEAGADLFTEAQGTIDVAIGNLDADSSRCSIKYSFDLSVADEEYTMSVDLYNVPFCVYEWTNDAGDKSWCFAPIHTALARPFSTLSPQRRWLCQSYVRYIKDWEVTLTMSGSVISELLEDEVQFKCSGADTASQEYFIIYTDYCFVGQSFNKIQYLKDITVKE